MILVEWIGTCGCVGDPSFRRKCGITDEPVWPKIHDFYLQRIALSLQLWHSNGIRRSPCDAQLLPIERHTRNVAKISKVDFDW